MALNKRVFDKRWTCDRAGVIIRGGAFDRGGTCDRGVLFKGRSIC